MADIDFVKKMIEHHKMALSMSKKEWDGGKDEEIRQLAKKIYNAQKKEIDFMTAWLKSQ